MVHAPLHTYKIQIIINACPTFKSYNISPAFLLNWASDQRGLTGPERKKKATITVRH